MAEQVSIKDFLRKREMATQELKFEGFTSPFVITEVSNEENEKLQKAATRTNKNQYGQVVRQVDQDKYADALVVKSVVQPDLNSKELQEFYGTLADPLGTLKKMLSMGELTKLVKAVNTLSLGDTLEEKVDEAKN
ncbi:phage tail assembly chaperone [Levilactobacillus brevis]|uniref:phage tail assembly chaperone n=1 Tax=Levilactobacillus brevis TaxID=1580 RepID=UPI003EB89FCE